MHIIPRFTEIVLSDNFNSTDGPGGDAVLFTMPDSLLNKAIFRFDGMMVGISVLEVTPTIIGMSVDLDIQWYDTIEAYNGRYTDDWISDIEVQWSDGVNDSIGVCHNANHVYTVPGTYQILVTLNYNDTTVLQNATTLVTVS